MRKFYSQLSEKDKRSYAAVESLKFGHGGQQYICEVLGCCPKVLTIGKSDLSSSVIDDRIRKKGGGPKRILDSKPELTAVFLDIINNYTAGDPMRDDIKWTSLSVTEIIERFETKGFIVSSYIVKQLLSANNFVKRAAKKEESIDIVEDRNAQFENIASIRSEFESAGEVIVSMDIKKRADW
jgi:hypothetical protein